MKHIDADLNYHLPKLYSKECRTFKPVEITIRGLRYKAEKIKG
jgi:hypothetical protein